MSAAFYSSLRFQTPTLGELSAGNDFQSLAKGGQIVTGDTKGKDSVSDYLFPRATPGHWSSHV